MSNEEGPRLELTAPIADLPQPEASSKALEDGVTITDKLGRRLTLKQPAMLAESHLMRALGEHSANPGYVSLYVMPAAMVVKVDDLDLEFPVTQRMVDASVQRLGRDGMRAVMTYLTKVAEAEKDKDPAQDTADLKK